MCVDAVGDVGQMLHAKRYIIAAAVRETGDDNAVPVLLPDGTVAVSGREGVCNGW